jgi:predicted lipid-binding transport protein (Tim44 family)
MLSFSPDIILLGVIAGVILFRLYTILGQKDGDGGVTAAQAQPIFQVLDISATAKVEDVTDLATLEQDLAPGFEDIVANVRKIDPNFSLVKFLDGAKKAFEMILTAFAENDRDTLKNLLATNIYKQFTSEIDKRISNEVKLDLTLVALPVVEIRNIKLQGNEISIDVFYGSQQVTLLKNDKGEIIEGDSSQIDHVEDRWTFSKTLKSKDNWLLVKVNAA